METLAWASAESGACDLPPGKEGTQKYLEIPLHGGVDPESRLPLPGLGNDSLFPHIAGISLFLSEKTL